MVEAERHLALGTQTVETFQDQIKSIGQDRVFVLPNLTEYVNHVGKYTRPRVSITPGIYLSPDLIDFAENNHGSRPESFTFMTQPGHSRSGEIS